MQCMRSFARLTGNITAVILVAVLLSLRINAAEVDARLEHDSVAAGSGTIMSVRISGGRADEPEIPAVENLIINQQGQSQQMSFVNGKTSISITYNYLVGSNTPGDYQIPPFDVTVDGVKFTTKPLKLKVLDSAASKPPAGMPQNPPGAAPAEDDDEGGKRFGFLTVELADNERKHAYVGEIAPVRIRAWLPADSRASLRSGIQPEGKAFTLHNVSDNPRQSHEMRDGKRYLVVTWFGGISATKAGKYPASLSVNATVAVRDPSALKPMRRSVSPFGGIFEDLNTPMIQKDVTLKSDDQEIEIRPLPKEGRPEGFDGAVGNFKFDDWEIPSNWKTGEPNQVRARLSGSGNFAMMNAPSPTPAESWKVYPGKDEFTPGDEASFSGSKIFQFSAVPRKGGDQNMSLEFSFFDPSAGAYKIITSAAKPIKVTGEDLLDDKPVEAQPAPQPVKKEDRLIGIHRHLSTKASLVPLSSGPRFQWLLGVSAVSCLLGGSLVVIRKRLHNPQRLALAAMEKSAKDALGEAERCISQKDVPGFFAASRLAIQHRLGAIWNQPAQAITLAEVMARMPHESPVAKFFSEADRLAYSRLSTAEIKPEWKSLLDAALASLANPNH